jgi:DNA-binding CsgD family transcriptional regulator
VLLLWIYGLPYKEIADRLHITLPAVKKRVERLHQKIGVGSQAELLAKIFGPGIL